jgi:DnaJ-class molecular chaperone
MVQSSTTKEKTTCTFENEHRVLVCDLAIAQVRKAVGAAFGDAVRLTLVPGQGTRVEVPPTEDAQAFQVVASAGSAAAQQQEAPPAEVDRVLPVKERAR